MRFGTNEVFVFLIVGFVFLFSMYSIRRDQHIVFRISLFDFFFIQTKSNHLHKRLEFSELKVLIKQVVRNQEKDI